MRRRVIRIEAFLSKAEAQQLENIQQASGLSKSTIVRQLISGCTVKPKPSDSYRDLTRELSAIGNNVNQIAHLANTTGTVNAGQIREIQSLLQQVWQLVQRNL